MATIKMLQFTAENGKLKLHAELLHGDRDLHAGCSGHDESKHYVVSDLPTNPPVLYYDVDKCTKKEAEKALLGYLEDKFVKECKRLADQLELAEHELSMVQNKMNPRKRVKPLGDDDTITIDCANGTRVPFLL